MATSDSENPSSSVSDGDTSHTVGSDSDSVASSSTSVISLCRSYSHKSLASLQQYQADHRTSKCFYYRPQPIPSKLTSPLASKVFILSRNPDSRMLDSSMMNIIFSSLHPDLRRTIRRSSSKSAAVYLRWTWTV